jgi:hypothetical protein
MLILNIVRKLLDLNLAIQEPIVTTIGVLVLLATSFNSITFMFGLLAVAIALSFSLGHITFNPYPIVSVGISIIASAPIIIIESLFQVGYQIMIYSIIVSIVLTTIMFLSHENFGLYMLWSTVFSAISAISVLGWLEILNSAYDAFPKFLALLISMIFISIVPLFELLNLSKPIMYLISLFLPMLLTGAMLYFVFQFPLVKVIGFGGVIGVISIAKYSLFSHLDSGKTIVGKSLFALGICSNVLYLIITLV